LGASVNSAPFLFFSSPAHANCLNSSTNERLSNYCLLKRSAGKVTTLSVAKVIDRRFKNEGYAKGLGLEGEADTFTLNPFVAPILDYETDINGGNPDRPLQLGNITFVGDPNFVRKEGIVVGAGAGIFGRYLAGEGRYVDYSVGASYAHSVEHDIGIQKRFGNICSKNHIKRFWYLDGCARTNYIEKDLSEETSHTLSLTGSKLFSSTPNNEHQVSLGINRLFAERYEQNQLSIGFQTIHSNGWHTSLNSTLGEKVKAENALREAYAASLSLPVFNRRLSLGGSYSEANGSRLLGIKRKDKTWAASLSYNVYSSIDVVIGYVETTSTIDFFDVSTPTVGLRVSPIVF